MSPASREPARAGPHQEATTTTATMTATTTGTAQPAAAGGWLPAAGRGRAAAAGGRDRPARRLWPSQSQRGMRGGSDPCSVTVPPGTGKVSDRSILWQRPQARRVIGRPARADPISWTIRPSPCNSMAISSRSSDSPSAKPSPHSTTVTAWPCWSPDRGRRSRRRRAGRRRRAPARGPRSGADGPAR